MPRGRTVGILLIPPMLAAPAVPVSAAYDPVSTIHFVRADGRPIVCPDKKRDTYYTILEVREDGSKNVYKWEIRTWEGDDHPIIRYLAGREREFRWMKVYVYCGEHGKPFVVTPRVRPGDLIRKGRRNFHYIVR